MKSTDLNQWQRHALKNKVCPISEYLTKLKKRMLTRGFQRGDPLFDAVLDAERATHSLYAQTQLLAFPGSKDGGTTSMPR